MSYFLTRTRTHFIFDFRKNLQLFENLKMSYFFYSNSHSNSVARFWKLKLALILFFIFEKTRNFSKIKKMSYFLTRTRTQTEYQYFEKLELALILFSIFEKTRNFSNIRKWGIFLTRTRTRFIFKFQKNSKLTLTYKNEEINWLKLFLTRVFWEKNNSNSRKKIPRVRKKNSHFFEKSAFSVFNSLVCFLGAGGGWATAVATEN